MELLLRVRIAHLCLSYTKLLTRAATGFFRNLSFSLLAKFRLSSRPRRQSGPIEPASRLWLKGGVQRAKVVEEPLCHHADDMRMHCRCQVRLRRAHLCQRRRA